MPAVKPNQLKDQWVQRFITLSGRVQPREDALRADRKIAALLDERAEVEKKMRGVIAGDGDLAEARKQVDRIAAEKDKLDPDDENYKQQLAALRAKCDEIVDAALADNQALNTLGKEHEALSAKIEQEVRRLNKQGSSPQPRKPEYEGEEKKVGWRADIWDANKDKDPVIKELFRESTVLRTEYYDAMQRDESELTIGPDGRVYTKDGLVRASAHEEYVINPETGKMHEFRQTQTPTGEKTLDPRSKKLVDAKQVRHHSSVLAGKEVTGAGGFETDYVGSLTKITNVSGHYKPDIAKLMQSVEKLLEQGAFLDKTWVGSDKLVGKENELLTQTEKAMSAASKLQVQVRQETLAMARVLDQNPEADVAAQATAIATKSVQLKKQLDAVAKAQQILAKLGASQKNKVTGEVEFVQVKDDMTGLQVKTAETKSMDAGKFLKTGGGYTKPGDDKSAAENKQAALQELEAKTAKQRQKLDADAEKSATQGSDELPHELDDVLSELAASLGEQRQAHGGAPRVARPQPSSSATTDHYSEAKIGPASPVATDDHYSKVELSWGSSEATNNSESDSEGENEDSDSNDSQRDSTVVAYKSTDPKDIGKDDTADVRENASNTSADNSTADTNVDVDEEDSTQEEIADRTFAYKTTEIKT